MLIIDPLGKSLNMNLEWLNGTYFSDFLIPGMILFLINGIGNIFGFVLSIRKTKYSGQYGSFLGLIMIIWIAVQVFLIGYKNFLQPLYFTTGLMQFIFGILSLKYREE